MSQNKSSSSNCSFNIPIIDISTSDSSDSSTSSSYTYSTSTPNSQYTTDLHIPPPPTHKPPPPPPSTVIDILTNTSPTVSTFTPPEENEYGTPYPELHSPQLELSAFQQSESSLSMLQNTTSIPDDDIIPGLPPSIYPAAYTKLLHDMRNKKVARVLSICGGGIRGIIPSTYLEQIENEIHIPIKELFHLIAGTSTGGIITCGVNDYPTTELSKIYLNESSEMFQKRSFFTNPFNLFNSKYKSTPLLNKYKQYFSDKTLADLTYDSLITFYDMTSRESRFFKSHRARYTEQENYPLWEVLACTSAAPTYFKPYTLKYKGSIQGFRYDENYLNTVRGLDPSLQPKTIKAIDGGVTNNNPTLCAFTEACQLYPNADAIMLLTLGTGSSEKSLDCKSLLSWGINIPDICMSGASGVVNHTIKYLSTIYNKSVYHININLNIPEQFSAMDNPSNVSTLREMALNDYGNMSTIRLLSHILNIPITDRNEICIDGLAQNKYIPWG